MTTKNKILLVLNILAIGLCSFFLIHTLFFEDSPNIKFITKAVPIILIYSFGVGRFLYTRIRAHRIMLSNQYLPFFTGAFQNDKKKYKQLQSVGPLLNKGRYEDAYNRIELLKNRLKNWNSNSAFISSKNKTVSNAHAPDTVLFILFYFAVFH